MDSSAYVKLAADGRLWSNPAYRAVDPTPLDRLHIALLNLATATSRTLPLAAMPLAFHTSRVMYQPAPLMGDLAPESELMPGESEP